MLTDHQIYQIADKMQIKCLDGCYYKDTLKYQSFQPNRGYIINLQDSTDDGNGTHYTLLYSQTNLHDNTVDFFYFDSTSGMPPEEVKAWTKQGKIPYNNKNVQGIYYNSSCGFWCLACLYMLSTYPFRLKHLFSDAEYFLQIFQDNLNKQYDMTRNEITLREFFAQLHVGKDIVNMID